MCHINFRSCPDTGYRCLKKSAKICLDTTQRKSGLLAQKVQNLSGLGSSLGRDYPGSSRRVYNLCSGLLSDNKELNRQLDFHREEEKKLPKAVINTETEKVPLKSHMKSKPDRVLQLKKAVPRYLFRSQTTAQNQIPTVNDVSMAGPYSDEDLPYQSDHNDDLS
jgi:hypothetical protein